MRVAIDQLDVALARPDQNFAQVAADVKEAAKAGADVIVIPEMWNTGYALDQLGDLADLDGQRTKQTLARLARDNQINIVGGSVAIKRGKRFYNTTYVYDRTGQLVGDYDKVHLFGLMNEGEFISAGHAPNRFALDGVKAASAICYDLRFPEWLRTISKGGSQILFYRRSGLFSGLISGESCSRPGRLKTSALSWRLTGLVMTPPITLVGIQW